MLITKCDSKHFLTNLINFCLSDRQPPVSPIHNPFINKTKIVILWCLRIAYVRDFLFHNLHNAPYLESPACDFTKWEKSLNFLFAAADSCLHAKIQTLIDTLKARKNGSLWITLSWDFNYWFSTHCARRLVLFRKQRNFVLFRRWSRA